MSRLRFRKVAGLDPALQTVLDHRYLRLAEALESRGAGRPAPRSDVHPASAKFEQPAEP